MYDNACDARSQDHPFKQIVYGEAKPKKKKQSNRSGPKEEYYPKKIPTTRKTNEFAHHGTKSIISFHFFLHSNEGRVRLVTISTALSHPYYIKMKLTASPNTGSRQSSSTAFSSHERGAMDTHAKDKMAVIETITVTTGTLERAYERDGLAKTVAMNLKSRPIIFVENFWLYQTDQNFRTVNVTISKGDARKRLPIVRPEPWVWIR